MRHHLLAFFLFFFLLLFTQCSLTRLPRFDPQLYQQIVTAAGKTDKLYIDMRLADTSHRHYSLFSRKYASVEKEINIISLQYESRPFNTKFLPIIHHVSSLFERYREEHRQKRIAPTNAELLIYQTYLRDAWKPLLIAEQSLK